MRFSVLHILRAPLGGAFRHVCDLIRTQRHRGLNVGLITDSADYGVSSRDNLTRLATESNCDVSQISIPRRPGAGDLAALRAIRMQNLTLQPLIVHGHGAKGAAYARILDYRYGYTSICTPHGGALHYSYDSLHGAMYLLMERALKRSTGGMIFESEYAHRRYVSKVGNTRFPYQIIRNGLYESEFEPVDQQSAEYDFLFVGEFRELKGVFTLLDAVSILRTAGRRVRILFVGSGPDEQQLRLQIEQKELSGQLKISPPIHPARTAFSKARCLIIPSHKESMPYIVLEAIAARMPLIATAVGGIPEIYGDGRDMLIPGADSTALATAMEHFIESPEHLREAADDLQSRARSTLTVAAMEARVFDFYQSVLTNHGASVAQSQTDHG